jgi:hypothetical protein
VPADRAAVGWADAELMARLADALAPDDGQPTEAGLAALRASLEARLDWPAGPAAARTREKRWTSWAGRSRRGLVALGLIAGISVGGTGVALAGGASLPEPVRVVAHHLGLTLGAQAPRPIRPSASTGLRPDRAGAASSRPAEDVRAEPGLATRPEHGGGLDRWGSGAAPPPTLSGSGPPESGEGWPLSGYRSNGPYYPGGHSLTAVPSASPSRGSDPAGRPAPDPPAGAQQTPNRPGNGGDPAGHSHVATAARAGGEATRAAGGGPG